MTRIALATALLSPLFFGACTLSEDQFAEELVEASCRLQTDCWDTDQNQEECEDALEGGDPRNICEDYDASAASDCIEAITDIADNCSVAMEDYEVPQVCNSVCTDTEEQNEDGGTDEM